MEVDKDLIQQMLVLTNLAAAESPFFKKTNNSADEYIVHSMFVFFFVSFLFFKVGSCVSSVYRMRPEACF